jgi:hypothetical protein
MELFEALHTGQLERFKLKFGEIILLPKEAERSIGQSAS